MGTKVFSAIQIDSAPRLSSLKKLEIGYRPDTGLSLPLSDNLIVSLVAVGFQLTGFRREIQSEAGKRGRIWPIMTSSDQLPRLW